MPVGELHGVDEITLAEALPGEAVQVTYLNIYNGDTAEVTILVKVYDAQGAKRTQRKRTIQVDDVALVYEGTDAPVIEDGERMVAALSAAQATAQPTYQVNTRRVR